jgi:hypothetical protein
MLDFISRLANRGAMLTAALVIALVIAIVYERNALGALQYVTAFAFYLAVMVAMIPVPALLRGHGRYHVMNWLVLAFALLYAGNAVYVGRWQSVALLAAGGAVIGLLVGVAAARRREPLPQS